MHDPIAASRRSVLRATAAQAVAALITALGFLVMGTAPAVSAGLGGLSITVGNVLAATMALRGIEPAGVAFMRLLSGTVAKWLVVVGVSSVALRVWRLPPLPLLAGLVVAMLAYWAALQWQARMATGHGK